MSRIRPCIAENFQNKVACIHDYSGFKSTAQCKVASELAKGFLNYVLNKGSSLVHLLPTLLTIDKSLPNISSLFLEQDGNKSI